VEAKMQDENAVETDDAARMRGWLDGVGGNVVVGEAKLKSVKISKTGNKLTIIVKKSRKKKKSQEQRTAR
jgi:hypothetical protein